MGEKAWQISIFFMTFYFIGALILFNLFTAILLDTFGENKEDALQEEKLESVFMWRDLWKEKDPFCTKKITATDFLDIILHADAPCGLGDPDAKPEHIADFLYELRLLTDQIPAESTMTWGQYFGYQCSKFKYWLCREIHPQAPAQQKDKNPRANSGNSGHAQGLFVDDDDEQSTDDFTDPWYIDFDAAVVSLCLKVLLESEEIDIPLYIYPENDERYIVDWYCRIFTRDEEMLGQLRDKYNAIENARVGMAEQELMGLLSDDEDYFSDEERPDRIDVIKKEVQPVQTPKDPAGKKPSGSTLWE